MAARALAKDPAVRSGRSNAATRFKPGKSGNPAGCSKQAAQAAAAIRELATEYGNAPDPDDPDARSRGIVALGELFRLGKGGNVPALVAFLDRIGLKPTDRVELSGDGFVFSIRKRVVNADSDPG